MNYPGKELEIFDKAHLWRNLPLKAKNFYLGQNIYTYYIYNRFFFFL